MTPAARRCVGLDRGYEARWAVISRARVVVDTIYRGMVAQRGEQGLLRARMLGGAEANAAAATVRAASIMRADK